MHNLESKHEISFYHSHAHCSYRIPKEVIPTLALTKEEIWESTDIGTNEIFKRAFSKIAGRL